MPTLQLLIIAFFLIPHLLASSPEICDEWTCAPDSPRVRFPFSLKNALTSRCGYEGFDIISCNHDQTRPVLLTLPSSGDFIVRDVDYRDQKVQISDLESCLPRRFLERDFSLIGSPFSFPYRLENYTFLNCSSHHTWDMTIDCLSNENYTVVGVPSYSVDSAVLHGAPMTSSLLAEPHCWSISTAMVPLQTGFVDWDTFEIDFRLKWDVPDCRFCEQSGGFCGPKDIKSSKLECFTGYNYNRGLSETTKYAIAIAAASMGIAMLIVVFVVRLRNQGRKH